MGILFALASAVSYGLADFAGGMLSRRMNYALVAFLGQLGGLAATALVAAVLGAPSVRLEDLLWGAASGVGTGVGMVFLYRAISRSDMSVAVPVSAVTGIALPVIVGVVALGERPRVLAWAGIVISVPALALVSGARGSVGRSSIPLDALIAGAGIAAQYLALAFPAAAAGLWPLTAGRAAAVVTVLPLLLSRSRVDKRESTGAPGSRRTGTVVQALGVGTLPAAALACYTLAVRFGLLTTAVVLSSLYPVIPVVLGIAVLGERPTAQRIVGFVGAAAAVLLITGGS